MGHVTNNLHTRPLPYSRDSERPWLSAHATCLQHCQSQSAPWTTWWEYATEPTRFVTMSQCELQYAVHCVLQSVLQSVLQRLLRFVTLSQLAPHESKVRAARGATVGSVGSPRNLERGWSARSRQSPRDANSFVGRCGATLLCQKKTRRRLWGAVVRHKKTPSPRDANLDVGRCGATRVCHIKTHVAYVNESCLTYK